MDPATIDTFLTGLQNEGLAEEIVWDAEARDYLSWRVRMAFAQRADHFHHALEYQAERDRVLARALEFLAGSESQADLFAQVDPVADRARRAEASGRQPSGSQ